MHYRQENGSAKLRIPIQLFTVKIDSLGNGRSVEGRHAHVGLSNKRLRARKARLFNIEAS
jgi:hypothetical protein